MPITTVLSDLGNVAVFFDQERACGAMAALTGRSAAAVRHAVFRRYELLHRYCRGEVTTPEFLRIVCARLNIPKASMPDPDALGRAFADVFTPNEPVLERWALLRRAGVTLTAVSNIEELRRLQLDRMGLLARFDHVLVSYEEGLMKPSDEFMVRALDRSACAAEDAVFVDDLAENLPPAAGLGIAVHRYSSVDGLDRFLEAVGLADRIA